MSIYIYICVHIIMYIYTHIYTYAHLFPSPRADMQLAALDLRGPKASAAICQGHSSRPCVGVSGVEPGLNEWRTLSEVSNWG